MNPNDKKPSVRDRAEPKAENDATAAGTSAPGIVTDNPRIFALDDGDTMLVMLKRPLSADKVKEVNFMDTATLKDGKVFDRIKLRVPRVSDRRAVAKMPSTLNNPIEYEFQLMARITDVPTELLEFLTQGDWENCQEALGKLTD